MTEPEKIAEQIQLRSTGGRILSRTPTPEESIPRQVIRVDDGRPATYDDLMRGWRHVKDACQVCHGAHGGVPGNENIVNGVVMCDYCHAAMLSGA